MLRSIVQSVSGYPGLFGLCVTSGILMPVPEDFPLVYAGVRISTGEFGWLPTLAVCMVGVGIRDVVAYWFGRLLGERLMESRWAEKWVGLDRIEWAEDIVRRRGGTAVLVGRFLIGFRAPIFAVAGASRVPFRQFMLFNSLGMLVAVPGVVALGWFFGDPIGEMVLWAVARAREVVLLGALGLGARWWWQRRNKGAAETP